MAWLPGPALALFLVLATGCTKEELAAPDAPSPMLVHKVQVVPDTTTQSEIGAPISDDGDNLGDRERSKRPH